MPISRSIRFSRWAGAFGAAAALLALAACGSESRSENSDRIVVYSGRSEELVAPLLEQFTEETGIKVELVRRRRAGRPLITEGGASPADVFLSQDAGAPGAVSKAGLSRRPPPPPYPGPSRPRAADGTWVGVRGRVRVIADDPDA